MVRLKQSFRKVPVKQTFTFAAFLMVAVGGGCSCTTGSKSGGSLQNADVKVSASAESTRDASIILVNVDVVPEKRGLPVVVEGQFEDRTFSFYRKGSKAYQAVVGIPYLYGQKMAKIDVAVNDGRTTLSYPLEVAVVHNRYPLERLSVDPHKVTPPQSEIPRIDRERAEVKTIYKMHTPSKFWKGPFRMPVSSKVTSRFGSKRTYNGSYRNFHSGLDLRAKKGAPIRSAAPGVVVLAKDLYYTGNTVILDHGFGLFTLYAHMNELKVEKGDRVTTGKLLGLSGSTGRVNGPHLHWGAIVHGVKVNPVELTRLE